MKCVTKYKIRWNRVKSMSYLGYFFFNRNWEIFIKFKKGCSPARRTRRKSEKKCWWPQLKQSAFLKVLWEMNPKCSWSYFEKSTAYKSRLSQIVSREEYRSKALNRWRGVSLNERIQFLLRTRADVWGCFLFSTFFICLSSSGDVLTAEMLEFSWEEVRLGKKNFEFFSGIS